MTTDRDGRLLLVEDEDLLRGLVAQFLDGPASPSSRPPTAPRPCGGSTENGPFDLALVDLNLPHLSGVDVCRSLRGRWPDHPVIICSAAILGDHEAALRPSASTTT